MDQDDNVQTARERLIASCRELMKAMRDYEMLHEDPPYRHRAMMVRAQEAIDLATHPADDELPRFLVKASSEPVTPEEIAAWKALSEACDGICVNVPKRTFNRLLECAIDSLKPRLATHPANCCSECGETLTNLPQFQAATCVPCLVKERDELLRNELTPEEVERLILLVGEAIYDGERGRERSSNIELDREILRKLEQMK